jgi:hypothetical protein
MKNLSIDMKNPAVRDLMGTNESGIVRPGEKRRELVHLAGDPEGDRGISCTYRADTAKQEVIVVYKDFVMTVDVYALPGEPVELHIICPKCRNKSRITAARKKIDLEFGAGKPIRLPDGRMMQTVARLSVEPFQCSWEMPGAGEHKPGIRAGGLTLCQLKLAIDNNVAKDA